MMTRRFEGGRLVIASHNPGKVAEIEALLAPLGADVVSAGGLNLPEPEETGSTFAANAELKARAAAVASGYPALADDSGLAVEALGGEPGIYSARWAKVEGSLEKDFALAMEKVEKALEGASDRRAHFVCALAMAWPNGGNEGDLEIFKGFVHGHLVWPPRGKRGFGYDPMFVPQGHDITFGQMDPGQKHAISHRALAFRQLVAACFER